VNVNSTIVYIDSVNVWWESRFTSIRE
jgi:hypothetical protein